VKTFNVFAGTSGMIKFTINNNSTTQNGVPMPVVFTVNPGHSGTAIIIPGDFQVNLEAGGSLLTGFDIAFQPGVNTSENLTIKLKDPNGNVMGLAEAQFVVKTSLKYAAGDILEDIPCGDDTGVYQVYAIYPDQAQYQMRVVKRGMAIPYNVPALFLVSISTVDASWGPKGIVPPQYVPSDTSVITDLRYDRIALQLPYCGYNPVYLNSIKSLYISPEGYWLPYGTNEQNAHPNDMAVINKTRALGLMATNLQMETFIQQMLAQHPDWTYQQALEYYNSIINANWGW